MGTRGSSDAITNLAQLLPTGTFLAFQTLAPLFTNNGSCGTTEKILTGVLILFFVLVCFILSFFDSITTKSGKVYYGLLTRKGLYNPQFKKSSISGDLKAGDDYFTGGIDNDDFVLHFSDFVNAILNVVIFGVVSGLTAPVTTCYYPGIPNSVTYTVPILVAMFVGGIFAFSNTGRHGVGFAVTASGFGLVPDADGPNPNTAVDEKPAKPEDTPAPQKTKGESSSIAMTALPGSNGKKAADAPKTSDHV